MARLKSKGATDPEFQAATYSIVYKTAAGRGGVNLVNVYADACKVPASEVVKVIDGFLNALDSAREQKPSSGFETAASQLMPVARDVRYFGMSNLMIQNSGVKPEQIPQTPYVPLAGEVVLALFLDSDKAMQQVTKGHLDEWGVNFGQAMERAMTNLRARSEPRFKPHGDGLFVSDWNDDYDGSRLLLTDMLLRLNIRGAPVVGLPARSRLLVAGSEDPGALDRLVMTAAALIESEQRPMTAQLFKLENERWKVFDHRLRSSPKLREAELKLLLRDYAQQKELLEAILARQKQDVFVASCQAYQMPDGSPFTMAQWTKNVGGLLPQADQLGFLDMDTKEMIVAPWPLAVQVLGARLAPQGFHPERYLATGFPDTAQLAKLRGGAIIVSKV